MKKKGSIAVTGVAGFIGFHVAEALLQKGYQVIGIDSMDPYYDLRLKRKRLAQLRSYKTFSFHKLSLINYFSLEKVLKHARVGEIIHLAAQAGVRYSLVNPWAYAQNNYVGTLNVFETARRLHIPRVIYASSSSVYGGNTETPFSESHRTDRPLSVYAASKKANEVLAYAYHHLFGIEVIGLRFFTVYGPWGRPDMAMFIFTKNILSGKPIKLYNRGKMKRSFTHVSDVVAPILALIKRSPAKRCEVFNLGGSEAVPLLRVVELIEKYVGKRAKYILLPLQPGDVPDTLADTQLARRKLGYKPSVSIEKGIGEFVEWFQKNKTFLLSLEEPKQ